MKLINKLWYFINTKRTQLVLAVFACLALNLLALNSFFSGDDWFHLQLVQINTWQEFFNFFNPIFNPQSTAFFRPIPNQFFFFILYKLFGFWSVPYFALYLFIYTIVLWLFYKIINKLFANHHLALLATFIFGFSHTHFATLYFLSAGQELMMNLFFLGSIYVGSGKIGKKKLILSLVLYSAALLSKENSLVLPIFLLTIDYWQDKKIYLHKLISLAIVSILYLYIRFFVFHSPMTEIAAYTLNFSPLMFINTAYFYFIWLLGAPELMQDYLSSPIKAIPRFYSDLGWQSYAIAMLLTLEVIALAILVWVNKQMWSKIVICSLLACAALGPILLLPQHKFAMQTSVALMCFATLTACLLISGKRFWRISFLIIFIALNFISWQVTYRSHYSMQRAKISRQVFSHFEKNRVEYAGYDIFVVENAATIGSHIPEWGSSKQVSHALWGSNFVQAFFNDKTKNMYFADDKYELPPSAKVKYLSAGEFLP